MGDREVNATSIENYTQDACRTESKPDLWWIFSNAGQLKRVAELIAETGNQADAVKRVAYYKSGQIEPVHMGEEALGIPPLARHFHGLLTLASEAGELAKEILSAAASYGQPDETNIAEEIGDSCWGAAILADACGLTLEECMSRNIAKLKRRYPNGWTQDAALNRDLAAERTALEGESNGQL